MWGLYWRDDQRIRVYLWERKSKSWARKGAFQKLFNCLRGTSYKNTKAWFIFDRASCALNVREGQARIGEEMKRASKTCLRFLPLAPYRRFHVFNRIRNRNENCSLLSSTQSLKLLERIRGNSVTLKKRRKFFQVRSNEGDVRNL